MQAVINISDSVYKDLQLGIGVGVVLKLEDIVVLPEGHGRLGDLDELEQRISNFVEHDAHITDEYTVERQRFIVDGIRQAVAFIKADGGDAE